MTTYKDKINNLFVEFSNIMSENTIGVKIGCYSVALVGLTVAVRRVRPFSRFKNPSDIPQHFIQEGRQLRGIVSRIDPNGGLLLTDHIPLISLPFVNATALPVKILGINVTRHGISWLQTIVVGSEVKFVPVLANKDWVQCEVSLEQQTSNKKLQSTNIAESLVSVGFATINDSYTVASKKYRQRLQIADIKAQRKKLGLKYYIKPTNEFLLKLVKKLYSFITEKTTKLVLVR